MSSALAPSERPFRSIVFRQFGFAEQPIIALGLWQALTESLRTWKRGAKLNVLSLLVLAASVIYSSGANAASSIQIAQCAFQAACWYNQTPTPWSADLSLQQLQTLGLGKEVTLQVVQTSYYVIRLGATNIEFATPSGTVKHYIPEFNGGYYSDYCNPCEIDNLGQFKIPKDATSATISGKFGNSEVPNTASVDLNLLSAGATISLARQTLTQVEAIGSPSGGTFSYSASTLAQNASTIALANGVAATDNPNTTVLTAPEGDGSPTPGGLTQFTAKYSLKYSSASKSFKAAAFGMSCYMIALESDYGTPPKNCTSLTYNGLKIAGSVKNPAGLAGTYCRSFIFNVKLQGSAQLSTGDYIHYNVGTKTISVVDSVTGSDGTALVAGRTVARDKAIIFKKGILVDVDNIGYGLLANDTGGAIKGYRLDLFNGAGVAVCEDFSNPIEMSVCETSMAKCPGSVIK